MNQPPSPPSRRAAGTARLLEQVARRVLEKRSHNDLFAAQWSALRYFARTGSLTANISGLSAYLGNTSGSTSRTADSLVERELLTKTRCTQDGRSFVFTLTQKGQDILSRDPLLEIARALDDVPPEDLSKLAQLLDRIERDLQRQRDQG